MELPKRKRMRLPQHNYAENDAYFVTICSHEHTHIFGEIPVGQGFYPCRRLSSIGKLIDKEILKLETRYAHIHADKYVIMPNHVHLLLRIVAAQSYDRQGVLGREAPSHTRLRPSQSPPCPTDAKRRESVSDAVRVLKSITTKQANARSGTEGRKIWQFRFHDHIIRNEKEYQEIAEYIENNPIRWEQDRYCFAAHTQNLLA